ncbi:hypothetical protein HanIR_Chr02g0053631 [Helianthus annuus]|nr:hypothetical protein HanIR_Chr02g0053631 [Helianthus annuus]
MMYVSTKGHPSVTADLPCAHPRVQCFYSLLLYLKVLTLVCKWPQNHVLG